MVEEFIELYAKPHQRSWDGTERTLLKSVPPDWLDRDICSITRGEAVILRDQIAVTQGHVAKARAAVAWLRKLWRWAVERDYLPDPIMDRVKVPYPKRPRDRVYADDEIKAIWQAAEQLAEGESAYVKLALLLAPRKTALAAMLWADIDFKAEVPTWKTPHEYTKSRKTADTLRCYLTPLPPLTLRILQGLSQSSERVFPSLIVNITSADRPTLNSARLVDRLVRAGAPEDFAFHACRHTLATWLQNEGRSEWERGLVLNHAGTGSVTAGYSHGYPLKLKLELLTEWSDHVENLVQSEGVTVLR